ncbi:hypothetical protein [Cohnella hongkongensis]|uniref:Uncharacterized protein n=1 Tax=Cohnella hongkongensis TaxID=178337 RepID=A0ABV9F5A1_9BACL
MSGWHISKEQYETLLTYFGCGDFEKAKIVVFGIEEGTGGYEIEENVMARVHSFGSFDSNGKLISAINAPSRDQGYWEPNGQSGGRKVREYIAQRDGVMPKKKAVKGGFNEIVARICLELEQPNFAPNYWFQFMGHNKKAAEMIRKRRESLFQTDSDDAIHTALTDLKPLPRKDMKKWCSEYEPSATQFGIDHGLYEKAFSLKYDEEYADPNTNYTEDVKKRLAILRNVFNRIEAPIVVGLGEIPVKKRILEKIFPEACFESFASNVSPRHSGLKADMRLPNRTVTVLLLPFPDRTSSEWSKREDERETAGAFMLRYFQEITQNLIKPALGL